MLFPAVHEVPSYSADTAVAGDPPKPNAASRVPVAPTPSLDIG